MVLGWVGLCSQDLLPTTNIGIGRLLVPDDTSILSQFCDDSIKSALGFNPRTDCAKLWFYYDSFERNSYTETLDEALKLKSLRIAMVGRCVMIRLPNHWAHSVVTISSYTGFGFYHMHGQNVIRMTYHITFHPLVLERKWCEQFITTLTNAFKRKPKAQNKRNNYRTRSVRLASDLLRGFGDLTPHQCTTLLADPPASLMTLLSLCLSLSK